MRLYHCPQVSQKAGPRNRRERHHCWMLSLQQVSESHQREDGDLIEPRKLPNPVLASHLHRNLHQELLLCHRRGLLPKKKTELQCVLEHKQKEQRVTTELALLPPSDLEVKLCLRLQRIQIYEQEEKGRSQSLKEVPEFVRVRGSLKQIQTVSY